MDFLEVSAKTVDEAITKACMELGRPSDELEIEVISEGSAGFLGFGSKPAVIQVRAKESEKPLEEPVPEEKKPEGSGRKRSRGGRGKQGTKPAASAEEEIAGEEPVKREHPVSAPRKEEPVPPRTEEEIAAMKAAAEKVLDGVFRSMEMPVTISAAYDPESGSLDVDLEGDDMGVLIGKCGQTLDSLQYLTSLVVNREQKNYVRVKLDTEDYRRRRKDTLENLAKNIAGKVKRNHKAVVLEPMNPYERRIIHSALQNNPHVETYSEGNEPYRHVVVSPTEK